MIELIATILSLLCLLAAICLCMAAKRGDERMSCLEQHAQDDADAVKWLIFHAIAIWSSISCWLRIKRVCAWHKPKPIRMGGNPFAKRVTHGMCPQCFRRETKEILSHNV